MQHEQAQAARAVARVLEGSPLSAALASVDDGSPLRGRTLVQELAYGTLRHFGTLAAIVARLATRPPADAEVRALLAVALYQLRHTRAPAFAIVDRAVDAAGVLGHPRAGGLVNALLRRELRERATIDAALVDDPVARWSHPRWWIERVRRDWPDDWQQVLAAGNERPPLTLRVNVRATTRDALLATFRTAGIDAQPQGSLGILVDPPRPVTELPGYADGLFAVQDLGAQLAAQLLDLRDGQRVLDACAAPGGKTTHILESADVDVTALDSDPARLQRIRDNLARLRHAERSVRVVAGDAAEPRDWWDGRPFDRILADVPCTASGVVRRHPDGKWLRRASDVAAFMRQQDRILAAAWPLLASGGKLLYVTCSVFVDENEARVAAFAARTPDALRETLTLPVDARHAGGQLLPSLGGASHNQDGFFYARLRKA